MTASVRISAKLAKELLWFIEGHFEPSARPILELRAALRPRPKKSLGFVPRKTAKAKKDRTKKELRQEVRAAIMQRADGNCEACGRSWGPTLSWDHFFGRVRVPETQRSGWALCHACDNAKTLNHPSAAAWLNRFIAHCEKYDFSEEAGMATRLLAKHEAKAELSRGVERHG